MSLDEQLWIACSDGDLSTTISLCNDPTVNVNWEDLEYRRTPFYRACFFGHLEIVRHLLSQSKVEVNRRQSQGFTAFGIACQEGHIEVVRRLLAEPRVDVTLPSSDGCTPFFMACQNGHDIVAATLLLDSRTDCNHLWKNETTPLWIAAQEGRLQVVRHLLASGRTVDTATASVFNDKTAAQQGRAMKSRIPQAGDTDEIHHRKSVLGPLIADLIDDYERDPPAVRELLRRMPGIREFFASLMFALIIFYSDGYLQAPPGTDSKVSRFLWIAAQLPLELQMVLSNRCFGSAHDLVKSKDSEPGFQWLAKRSTWQ